jgi:hypothetical protein
MLGFIRMLPMKLIWQRLFCRAFLLRAFILLCVAVLVSLGLSTIAVLMDLSDGHSFDWESAKGKLLYFAKINAWIYICILTGIISVNIIFMNRYILNFSTFSGRENSC